MGWGGRGAEKEEKLRFELYVFRETIGNSHTLLLIGTLLCTVHFTFFIYSLRTYTVPFLFCFVFFLSAAGHKIAAGEEITTGSCVICIPFRLSRECEPTELLWDFSC